MTLDLIEAYEKENALLHATIDKMVVQLVELTQDYDEMHTLLLEARQEIRLMRT